MSSNSSEALSVTFVNWDSSHVTILSSFTQPFVVPNLYDYAEHKRIPYSVPTELYKMKILSVQVSQLLAVV